MRNRRCQRYHRAAKHWSHFRAESSLLPFSFVKLELFHRKSMIKDKPWRCDGRECCRSVWDHRQDGKFFRSEFWILFLNFVWSWRGISNNVLWLARNEKFLQWQNTKVKRTTSTHIIFLDYFRLNSCTLLTEQSLSCLSRNSKESLASLCIQSNSIVFNPLCCPVLCYQSQS